MTTAADASTSDIALAAGNAGLATPPVPAIPPIAPDLVGIKARDLEQMILDKLPAQAQEATQEAARKRLNQLFRAYAHRRSMSPPEIRGQIDYDNNPGLSISELHGGQP